MRAVEKRNLPFLAVILVVLALLFLPLTLEVVSPLKEETLFKFSSNSQDIAPGQRRNEGPNLLSSDSGNTLVPRDVPSSKSQGLSSIFSRYLPEKGDTEENLRYLETVSRNSPLHGFSVAQEALSLIPSSTGPRSRALLLSLASAVGFRYFLNPDYESFSESLEGELKRSFPSNPYVWDLVVNVLGAGEDPKETFKQLAFIWHNRERNQQLKANDDSLLAALLISAIMSDELDRASAIQEIELSGGLEARSDEFFNRLDSRLPEVCADVIVPCSSPVLNSFLQTSSARIGDAVTSRPELFAILTTLSSIIAAYGDPMILRKQREYIDAGYSGDLRIELNDTVIREYYKSQFMSQSPLNRVLLVAGSRGFKDMLTFLTKEEIDSLRESVEEYRDRLSSGIVLTVVQQLKRLRSKDK